ncbi:MAG: hypothetical protein M3N46_06825 [Actinomycetota bacterium]|nr:hypothetical protein [Actinomycetota bacterium]
MTTPTPEALTAAIVALPGVHGVFPTRPISALALTLVTNRRVDTTALIDLTATETSAVVHARLALDRTTPTVQTLLDVRSALLCQLPCRTLELHVEIAYID